MKLIVISLAFLAVMALLSQMGLAEYQALPNQSEEYTELDWTADADGWWLMEGRRVMDVWGNRLEEFGQQWTTGDHSYWLNTTNAYDPDGYGDIDPNSKDTSYPLIWMRDGEHADFSRYSSGQVNMNVDITGGTYGVIAIITVLLVLAGVVGLKIFSSGIDTGALIVKGTGYLMVWALLSIAAYGVITQIQIFGVAFYFVITLMYAVGVIGQFGGGGE